MCLIAAFEAPAQTGAAANTDGIQPLQFGDKIPEELWHFPLQVVNHPEGKETITLNDYRGKLIILDFWATWCAPCISSLYKLDTLQAQFGDELAVIPTTYEQADKVIPFFAEKGWSLPTATSETTLRNYFPYQSIPHQVWVKDGQLLAFAGPEYTQVDIIRDVLAGNPVTFRHKIEVPFDKSKPLFLNGNGGNGSNMLYQSVISRRLQARIGGVFKQYPEGIIAYNRTIKQLYIIALERLISPLTSNEYIDKYIRYEIDDKLKYRIESSGILARGNSLMIEQWADSNLYCYNLVLPEPNDESTVYEKMFKELNEFFESHLGLRVTYEMRTTDVFALVAKSNDKSISTKGGKSLRRRDSVNRHCIILQNQPPAILIHYLNLADATVNKPVVDQTGISGNIDIKMDFSQTDIRKLRRDLSKHGLDLVEKPACVNMIVFSKKN